jgi:hypothetical protein
MTEIVPPDVFGFSVFCDDIRVEEGGKISLIGVYQEVMHIHGEFPFVLAKLGIMTKYYERKGTRTGPLELRVFLPGDHGDKPSMVGAFPIEELRNPPPGQMGEFAIVQLRVIISPFVVKEAGHIKVRAYCDDDILRMGALKIEKAAPAAASPI